LNSETPSHGGPTALKPAVIIIGVSVKNLKDFFSGGHAGQRGGDENSNQLFLLKNIVDLEACRPWAQEPGSKVP
jgi:hypothetical protein